MNKKTSCISYSLMLAGLLAAAPTMTFAADSAAEVSTPAPEKGISGKVVDNQGEPVIGATVRVAGSQEVTITDVNGNFNLPNTEPGAKLQVSYIGYVTRVVNAKAGTMSIVMDSDSHMLDETVVIGYGVQKKSNVTGAISSIKADDLKNNVNTNAAQSLQGKVSGVQVVNASGAPGSAPQIRIRGYASNGKSDPLYIVDGLKVSDISYLDPSSIESMEILKDAASAAIYGAEAGNGVVLISTKQGAKGMTKITFDASWTYQSLAHKAELMNGSQFNQWQTEGQGDAYKSLYDAGYVSGTETDWQDQVFETGKMQKYNLGLQGGNDKGKFFMTLGYMNNDGMVVMDKDYYKRLTGQINASYKLRPWLEVQTQNTITNVDSQSFTEGNIQYGTMKDALQANPLCSIYYSSLSAAPSLFQQAVANGMPVITNEAGQYYASDWMTGDKNPLANIQSTDTQSSGNKSFFINGSTAFNITPFKNFVFTTRLGYTLGNLRENTYQSAQWYNSLTGDPTTVSQKMSMSSGQYTTRYYQWENFANYTLETKSMGNWGIMAGMSYSDYHREYTSGSSDELTDNASNFRYLDYSTSGALDNVYGNVVDKRQIAYYGRLSWDFLGRYNAQFNFRADSYDSAFLDLDHNWGYFPSASIGWTFSEEDFMKSLTANGIFTYGKFRASYGVNGSISNLGNYYYASNLITGADTSMNFAGMNLQNNAYVINGKLYQGTYPSSQLANPELRWERSKQWDFGLDLRWFSGRLTTTFDYYHKLTDGLLINTTALLTTGASKVYQNLGEVTNKGFEAELDWRDRIGDFTYEVKANIGTVSNKVSKYKGEGVYESGTGPLGGDAATYFEEGYPIWYIKGYNLTGVDSEGKAIYEDVDKDGTITASDRINLGSAIPDFTYGVTINLGYKYFDLSVYGAGAQGNKLMYGMLSVNNKNSNRLSYFYENRWTSGNTNATLPSTVQQMNDKMFYNSSAMVFDASYFKIKQIQLGFTLPSKLCKKTHVLESFRVYASLDNFFTFTKYPGSDPELNATSSSSNSASAMAIDFGGYPLAKSFSFGVNVGF